MHYVIESSSRIWSFYDSKSWCDDATTKVSISDHGMIRVDAYLFLSLLLLLLLSLPIVCWSVTLHINYVVETGCNGYHGAVGSPINGNFSFKLCYYCYIWLLR